MMRRTERDESYFKNYATEEPKHTRHTTLCPFATQTVDMLYVSADRRAGQTDTTDTLARTEAQAEMGRTHTAYIGASSVVRFGNR